MNCLTLAYTLERAVFNIGYDSKAFQTSAAVQAPAETSHFSDSGAGFEEQGVVGLNTNEGSRIFPVISSYKGPTQTESSPGKENLGTIPPQPPKVKSSFRAMKHFFYSEQRQIGGNQMLL